MLPASSSMGVEHELLETLARPWTQTVDIEGDLIIEENLSKEEVWLCMLAVFFTGLLLSLPRLIIWLCVEDSKDHSMDFVDEEQYELDLDANGCLSDFWPSSRPLKSSSPYRYSSRNRRLLSSSLRPSFFDMTYQCIKFNRLAANSYRKSALCKPALSTIYEEPLRFDGA